ncbi:MAG: porin [Acidobacteriota bacterium]|nr:porin [Acidobacteriota bacterium]
MNKYAAMILAGVLSLCGAASAQANFSQTAPEVPDNGKEIPVKALAVPKTNLEIYGLLDEYAGYTDAAGTGSQFKLDSGGWQATRLGFRGSSEINDKVKITYTLENGFYSYSGGLNDTTRLFNRQAWFGVAGKFGEFRVGRENSPLFDMLGSIDSFSGATFGSFLNNASGYTPRFDDMLSYRSPVMKGWRLQAHTSIAGINSKYSKSADVLNAYIGSVDYNSKDNKVYFVSNYQQQVAADRSFSVRSSFTGASYDYGRGKVYAGYFHGNSPQAGVGDFSSANVAEKVVKGPYWDLYSFSGNYRLTRKFRVGAGWGWGSAENGPRAASHEPSVIGAYDFAKWGMIWGTAGRMVNEGNADFGLGAAGPITKNLPATGKDVTGVQLGIRFNFSAKLIKPN